MPVPFLSGFCPPICHTLYHSLLYLPKWVWVSVAIDEIFSYSGKIFLISHVSTKWGRGRTDNPEGLVLCVSSSIAHFIHLCFLWGNHWDLKLWPPHINQISKHRRDWEVERGKKIPPHNRAQDLDAFTWCESSWSIFYCAEWSDPIRKGASRGWE